MFKKTMILGIIILSASVLAAEGQDEGRTAMSSYLLLDDFKGEKSAVNTRWKGFTDQVMGGVSQMTVTRVPDEEEPYIRMQGRVSLENNGGFIQVRLKLTPSGALFNGSSYQGVRVRVRGEGTGYYIFLRNAQTILPWKYFAAPIPVTGEWQTVDIPWEAFKPGDFGRLGKLKVNRLKSLALVAYGREFNAKIDMAEIGLY